MKGLPDLVRDRPGRIRVVSFDVFDTLIWRLTSPRSAARHAAHLLALALRREGLSAPSKVQILDERHAFERSVSARYPFEEAEWAIDEWLKAFARDYELPVDVTVRLGVQAELDADLTLTALAPDAAEAVRLAREEELTVIASSDTVHRAESIERLLKASGLALDRVFSSADMKRSKRRGTAFEHIASTLGVEGESILHLGDNWKADLAQAASHGWSARLVERGTPTARSRPRHLGRMGADVREQVETISRALAPSRDARGSDPLYRNAFHGLAPLLGLFSLVQWRHFREQRIDAALYIARDARALLDAYELLEPLLPDSPRRHYIRLSRQAVSLAHPGDLLQSLSALPGKVGRRTVGELLAQFQLDERTANELLSTAGVSRNMPLDERAAHRLRGAISGLAQTIRDAQLDQRALIRDYLVRVCDESPLARVAIVDSGWAGTTQDAISACLPDAELVSGLYLGVSGQGVPSSRRCPKMGLLRDDFRCAPYENTIERSAGVVRVWDLLLREPVGTVARLERRKDGSVHPVLRDWVPSEGEEQAIDSISRGLADGIRARLAGFGAIVALSHSLSDDALALAASGYSRSLVARPSRSFASAVMSLSLEEGSAGNRQASLGLRGVVDGIAWYPGLAAVGKARSLQGWLELGAELAWRARRGRG